MPLTIDTTTANPYYLQYPATYGTTATTATYKWETSPVTLDMSAIDDLINLRLKESFSKLYAELVEITKMQITEEEFMRILTE